MTDPCTGCFDEMTALRMVQQPLAISGVPALPVEQHGDDLPPSTTCLRVTVPTQNDLPAEGVLIGHDEPCMTCWIRVMSRLVRRSVWWIAACCHGELLNNDEMKPTI